MKNRVFIFVVIMGGLMYSCKQEFEPTPPIAEFFAENNGCIEPCSLIFYNNSQFENALQWDFGNQVTSSDEIVTVRYEKAGTYDVVLEAFGEGTLSDIELKRVTIGESKTMIINDLTLTQISILNSQHTPWDVADGPDIYFAIMNDVDSVFTSSPTTWGNVLQSNLPISQTVDYKLESKTIPYNLLVIDKDNTGTEIMLSKTFLNFDYRDYPENITIIQDSIIVDLNVTWEE